MRAIIMCIIILCSDSNNDDGEHKKSDLVQQLKQQLSRRKMIFSKNHIHLTKVVGQGIIIDFQAKIRFWINLITHQFAPLLCRGSRIGLLWLP